MLSHAPGTSSLRAGAVRDGVGDLPGDGQRVANVEWSLRQTLGERRTFDELEVLVGRLGQVSGRSLAASKVRLELLGCARVHGHCQFVAKGEAIEACRLPKSPRNQTGG